jgi:hypothetical protein
VGGDMADEIRTVDDLIKAKNLTAEELVEFKDMIEEFKERERKIEEHVSAAKSNLNQLSNSMKVLGERASIISKALRISLDEMERIQLRMMPNDKFYRE